ncbi:MAG TPA: hypothetical protein VN397_00100 [Candidatus Methylomirabilis sp.]|nr:hypothetical protein [Candidatus Methylomirabilis sp.]
MAERTLLVRFSTRLVDDPYVLCDGCRTRIQSYRTEFDYHGVDDAASGNTYTGNDLEQIKQLARTSFMIRGGALNQAVGVNLCVHCSDD